MKQTEMYCYLPKWDKENRFYGFYPHLFAVRCHADNEPVLKVLVTEEQETKESYWAWWDFAEKNFSFVYPRKMLLEMCFTYGPEVEIKAGKGLILPVSIVVIKTLKENEDE